MWYKHNDEEQLLLSAEKIENHKASLFSQLLLDPQIKSIPKNKHSKSFKSIAPTENYFFNDYESVDLESKDCAKVLSITESINRMHDARIEKETKKVIKNKGIHRKQASLAAKDNNKANLIPSYFEDISKISLNNNSVKLIPSKKRNPVKLLSTNPYERLEELNKNLYRKINNKEFKQEDHENVDFDAFSDYSKNDKQLKLNNAPAMPFQNIHEENQDFEKRIMKVGLCKFSLK